MRIRRKIIIYLLFCVMAVNQLVDAQDTLHPVIMVKSTPAVILKFTPSMLLDLDNTLTLGVELPLNSRWSVQQEIGWGNSQFNLWGDDSLYPHKNNWRFRTQLRYFIFKSTTHQGGWYLAAEYFRKEVFIRQVHAFGRDCNPITGTCAYFQEGILRTRRRVSAIHGKLGYQWILPDNRISLDLYMGGLSQTYR
ncbi:MAG: DUF3575 domain-containing protein [Spirosomataceae bacterium]